jgi:N-methylhydantoinase B
VVLAALAPVLERHPAGSSDALWITVWSPHNLTLFQSGGAGAWHGRDGAPGEVSVDGRPLPTKRLTRLQPAAAVRLDLPGGGGVGDPRERDPQAVLRDVVDGYVSLDAAREIYGVRIRRHRDGRVLLPEDFDIEEDA